ncbi:hypothetical protein JC2156_13840 [Weissella koreensis KCTC 3621]|uniref:hypothetical protein n=1 Tax=Weissella koreensis TaxID=165096 RepID=UPI00026F3060|nr:hypothetical protein [Weissella koreensis]EJF34544.1 hypothetical protein JC2156_13840 [Weissella koreensis KCTC 3621]
MTTSHYKVKTPEQSTKDIISGQVLVINNQTRRIDDLKQSKKKYDEFITTLQSENDTLKYENKGLKTALKFQMTGDK